MMQIFPILANLETTEILHITKNYLKAFGMIPLK
jgi:hypothetical protein